MDYWVLSMKIDELKQKCSELNSKTIEMCKLSEVKKNKDKFKYRGVYILTDEEGEIVYIGSAYVRNVRERLMQYQQSKNSGNSTLYKDLIDGGKCKEDEAEKYIKSLTAHAFQDNSLEYRLIENCETAVNISGK